MFSSEKQVILSSQAYLSMISEAYSFLEIETGGIFLGTISGNIWYVLECIDPGYKNTTRRHAYFEYDVEYVNHLANVRRRLYQIDLKLLGLWHRHPGSLDRFSATDDVTNTRFAEMLPQGAISAIVNLDPHFRLTMYHTALPLQYTTINNILIGDSHLPTDFLRFKNPDDLINKRGCEVIKSNKPIIRSWNAAKYIFGSVISGVNAPMHEEISKITKQQKIVMEMLETELEEYLEKQIDYSYDIRMNGDSIELHMSYIGQMVCYPNRIECIFSLESNHKIATINNKKYSYIPAILWQFVEDYIKTKILEHENNKQYNEADAEVRHYLHLLGLGEVYDEKLLKKAYLAKLKDYHPDTWHHESNEILIKNATIQTQKIKDAYEYLLNKYNQTK